MQYNICVFAFESLVHEVSIKMFNIVSKGGCECIELDGIFRAGNYWFKYLYCMFYLFVLVV